MRSRPSGPSGAAHLAPTVWRGPAQARPVPGGVDGATWGGPAPTGAHVTDDRELDAPASGKRRITWRRPWSPVDPASKSATSTRAGAVAAAGLGVPATGSARIGDTTVATW